MAFMDDPPARQLVSDWMGTLEESVIGHPWIRTVLLGGSRGNAIPTGEADTDLFIEVDEGSVFDTGYELQKHLRTTGCFVVSTMSFRQDFGLRVRAARSDGQCCSFFVFETRMIRNVAHQRRGRVLWRKDGLTAAPIDHLPSTDNESRQEDFADSLLEMPSAIKYIRRRDYVAASARLRSAIVAALNVATLDSDNYLAGNDKLCAERVKRLFPHLPDAPLSIAGGSRLEEVAAQAELYRELLNYTIERVDGLKLGAVVVEFAATVERRLGAGLRDSSEVPT